MHEQELVRMGANIKLEGRRGWASNDVWILKHANGN
jgi:UDP-N-acetylglucosamine enolpyruvyl transferase